MSSKTKRSEVTSSHLNEAIRYFQKALVEGKHWYVSLLETIRLWGEEEEIINGRQYRYLIENEAFDLLLTAERICDSCNNLIPKQELEDFFFRDTPPVEVSVTDIRNLIGEDKYRQYLNFFYGVVVEQNLFLAVQQEVRKSSQPFAGKNDHDTTNEAFQRIYSITFDDMLCNFRRHKHHSSNHSLKLYEFNEFCYWLFKYRLKNCDSARVASDTKKALCFINEVGKKVVF